jgi:histone H3/H4
MGVSCAGLGGGLSRRRSWLKPIQPKLRPAVRIVNALGSPRVAVDARDCLQALISASKVLARSHVVAKTLPALDIIISISLSECSLMGHAWPI